jgi:CheY-like chemotaxis protein
MQRIFNFFPGISNAQTMAFKISSTIVIIDDMPDVAEFMCEFLSMAGFDTTRIFSNPLEALDYIAGVIRPAVVIADAKMPEMSGVDLLTKAEAIHPGLNGIIITGNTFDESLDACRFKVVEKKAFLSRNIGDHILPIMKSHVLALLCHSPCRADNPACRLNEKRGLAGTAASSWIDSLTGPEISTIIKTHETCFA